MQVLTRRAFVIALALAVAGTAGAFAEPDAPRSGRRYLLHVAGMT